MSLVERYTDHIHHDLHTWAVEHAAIYPDIFVALDPDVDKYPDQHVNRRHIHGQTLDPFLIETIAADLDPRFVPLSQAIDNDPDAVTSTGEMLSAGINVVLGTGHSELLDMPFTLAKFKARLTHEGYVFRTAVIANSMIKYLGVRMGGEIIPATTVLGYAVDDIFTNLPTSVSAKQRMTIPPRVVSAYNNALVTHEIIRYLRSSRKVGEASLFGVALSGTVRKPLDVAEYEIMVGAGKDVLAIPEGDRERTLVAGRVSKGLLRMTGIAHTMTVPVAAQLSSDNAQFATGNAVHVSGMGKLDSIMGTINDLEQGFDDEHFYVYDAKGNLPTKKRSTEDLDSAA